MRQLTILGLTCLLIACSPTREKASEKDDVATVSFDKRAYFKKSYLEKFKMVNLPLTLRPTGNYPERKSLRTDSNSPDTLFYKGAYSIACYGLLPDTSMFYGVIWLEPADLEYPVITTYDKNGEIIDEREINIGYCGDDCGYHCTETVTIDKDYKIFSADSVTSNDCDTLGHIIETSTKKYVIFKTGQIKQNGKVEMSNELRAELK
jgi:hypothetical protein